MRRPGSARALLALLATGCLLLAGLTACGASGDDAGPARVTGAAASGFTLPRVRHVFVINYENKGYHRTWGADSAAPYLARTLRDKGVLLTRFYGTAHHSQGNYVAQVSGQGPNPQMQRDCPRFTRFHTERVGRFQQRVGTGCVFGRSTPTLMKQLDAHRHTRGYRWRAYMQSMTRRCDHPRLGSRDHRRGYHDQYATKHNPFMYFRSVIDRSGYCRGHVVGLGQLRRDLARASSTRTLSYITPDMCNDAHDAPCTDGRRGGLAQFDAWLRVWVPRILDSPAFRRNGMLIITADESDSPKQDSRACCGERAVNTRHAGIDGPGGGRIGALVISPFTAPGTHTDRTYNQYSLLKSVEAVLRLGHIGYARTPHLHQFGRDVFNR